MIKVDNVMMHSVSLYYHHVLYIDIKNKYKRNIIDIKKRFHPKVRFLFMGLSWLGRVKKFFFVFLVSLGQLAY